MIGAAANSYMHVVGSQLQRERNAELEWAAVGGEERYVTTLIGSLRNHDDDGNKNLTNLHIWRWKTVFLHALHVHFSFSDIL